MAFLSTFVPLSDDRYRGATTNTIPTTKVTRTKAAMIFTRLIFTLRAPRLPIRGLLADRA